jgi:Phytochelatin synthase
MRTRTKILLALLLLVAGLVGYGYLKFRELTSRRWDVVSIQTLPAYQDQERLARAWALPVAHEYSAEIRYQTKGSRCGPSSLANILGSLGDEDDTEDEVLAGTGYCWLGQCLPGLTLDEVAEIARAKTDAQVTVLRDLDLEGFREHLRRSNDPDRRYLINFHRGPLFTQGGGHHSPLIGYLEAEDLVFVLDVNEEFQPWLVPAPRLFAAMDTIDDSTAQKRGMLLFEPK